MSEGNEKREVKCAKTANVSGSLVSFTTNRNTKQKHQTERVQKMAIKPFDPNNEGISLDIAGLVKLQKMLTPEVETFRKLREEYRETCTPEETPEVSDETKEEVSTLATNVVNLVRSVLLKNQEVSLILPDVIKSLADDVKTVGKNYKQETGLEVSDGEGDDEKLQEFLLQRDRVGTMYKLFNGLSDFVLSVTDVEASKKAGLEMKENTKKNAVQKFVPKQPNDPSKSADEFGQAKAGRPATTAATFTYNYKVNGKAIPEGTSRYLVMLQASEGSETLLTWQDLHNAMKDQKQEIGADTFTVKMPNGTTIEGQKVKK